MLHFFGMRNVRMRDGHLTNICVTVIGGNTKQGSFLISVKRWTIMFLVYITACRHHLNVSSRLIYKLLKGICIVTCHVSLVTQVASVTRHVSDKEFDRKYHSTTSVNWNIPIHFFPCVRSIIVNPVMVSPYSKISLKSHGYNSFKSFQL